MALPIIPNTFRVTWNFVASGALSVPPAHNVTHYFSATGNESALRAALLANRVNAQFMYLSNAYRLDTCDVLPLDGFSSSTTQTFPTGVNGQASGGVLPQVCGILTFQTLQRGPQGRGRLFQGPSGEGAWDAGFVSSTTDRATWEAAWNTFNANMLTAGFEAVVASYKNVSTYGIQHVRGNSYSATQRRRMERLT